jgi:hypothetical protein
VYPVPELPSLDALLNMKVLLAATALLLASCVSLRGDIANTIVYHAGGIAPFYAMDIPAGYEEDIAISIHDFERLFWYPDSSVIYITSGTSLINIEKMDALEGGLFFSREALLDTLTLSGVDRAGLYWKDVKLGLVSAGYANVSSKKKDEYDRAISSLRQVR